MDRRPYRHDVQLLSTCFRCPGPARNHTNQRRWPGNIPTAKAVENGISANKGLELTSVQAPINRLCTQILQDPKTVSRFDASDQMPLEVGPDAEFTKWTAWLNGQDDNTTLAAIDAAWPP
jgi:hypothetical protein